MIERRDPPVSATPRAIPLSPRTRTLTDILNKLRPERACEPVPALGHYEPPRAATPPRVFGGPGSDLTPARSRHVNVAGRRPRSAARRGARDSVMLTRSDARACEASHTRPRPPRAGRSQMAAGWGLAPILRIAIVRGAGKRGRDTTGTLISRFHSK
jgi:hypothetical protein